MNRRRAIAMCAATGYAAAMVGLPEGWFRATPAEAARLLGELRRELPYGHVLDGVAVETFAHRDGATDDVLFRHLDGPERFTVVHLTWRGATEIDQHHPRVEVDGSFDEFLAYEWRQQGIEPPPE